MKSRIIIQKWGNGLGIYFPESIVSKLSLKAGLYVNLQEDGNRITIKPVKHNVSHELSVMLN